MAATCAPWPMTRLLWFGFSKIARYFLRQIYHRRRAADDKLIFPSVSFSFYLLHSVHNVCKHSTPRSSHLTLPCTRQSIASLLLDHTPSALFVGRSWPRLLAGDSTGRVYLLEVVFPTPLDLEDETAITQTRLKSPDDKKGASLT